MRRLIGAGDGAPGVGVSQTIPVGLGLLTLGLTAYGFLLLSARALGPQRYSSLSALWALVFLIGPGFFLPMEQELGRSLAARRVLGLGDGSLPRRAALLGGALAATLIAAIAVFRSSLVDELFDGQVLLLIGLVVSLVGYCAEHLVRGSLAGNGHFGRYGLVLGTEGTFRLAGCLALAVIGVSTAGPYGLVLGAGSLAAALVGIRRFSRTVPHGPPAPFRDLTSSIGWLLAASLSAQLLVNCGLLAVNVLATEGQEAEAGRFLAGLVIARVPLFLFQAVQASLLPRLSQLNASGRHDDLRTALRRLVLGVVAIAAVSTVAAATVGPRVVGLLFGSGFELGGRDLGLLAAATGAYMLALTLAQPMIAFSSPARVALGWTAGVITFVATTAAIDGLLPRVEWGYLVGSVVAAATMLALLIPLMGQSGMHSADELAAAVRDLPVEP